MSDIDWGAFQKAVGGLQLLRIEEVNRDVGEVNLQMVAESFSAFQEVSSLLDEYGLVVRDHMWNEQGIKLVIVPDDRDPEKRNPLDPEWF